MPTATFVVAIDYPMAQISSLPTALILATPVADGWRRLAKRSGAEKVG